MSLLTTIQSAAHSLSVFESAIGTIQSNVTNASVPNYTDQTPSLGSSWTGVQIKGTVDARDNYAEQAVWSANTNLGQATAQADNLSTIQSQFDVSGSSGVPGALSKIYSAFSAWATSPTDPTARNQVLVAANQVASAFNQASATLQQSQLQVQNQLSNTLSQINSTASQIMAINVQIQNSGTNPSLQAELYAALQQMSQFTTISVNIEANGTATVLMNSQVPLVVGTTVSPLSVAYPSSATATYPTAPGSATIQTASGQDVTASAAVGGQLAGLLQVRNQTLPGLLGNQNQQGSLNKLAQAFADRVNTIISAGQTDSGASGTPLFTYTAGSPTAIAGSLSVNSALTPDNLAAIQPGPPQVANGVPNQLAGLSNSSNPADQISGSNYTDYYSRLVADLGSQSAAASASKTSQTDQLTQAENLRSDVSGISLNEQAALLTQYQQAYQASSQMIQILNGLMTDLMNILQPTSAG